MFAQCCLFLALLNDLKSDNFQGGINRFLDNYVFIMKIVHKVH